MTLLDTDEDMRWLFETQLKNVPIPAKWAGAKCAVLHGNESGPDAIDLYADRAPLITDRYLHVRIAPQEGVDWDFYETEGQQ